MTNRECAIVSAYTGYMMFRGDDLKYFYDYIEEIMGRRLLTHELPIFADEIQEKSKPDFIQLCRCRKD